MAAICGRGLPKAMWATIGVRYLVSQSALHALDLCTGLWSGSRGRYCRCEIFCIMCRALLTLSFCGCVEQIALEKISIHCVKISKRQKGYMARCSLYKPSSSSDAAFKTHFLHALIRLRQPIEIRYRICTIKIPIPCLLRQDPGIHACFPTPLHRILRHPSPVEPPPTELKARHLCFGIRHEPLLVGGAVGAWVGIGAVTGAGPRIGRA